MTSGLNTFPRVVDRVYESEEREISSTAPTIFEHGFGRTPCQVDIVLVCKIANEGYVPGDEIPATMVENSASSDVEGRQAVYVIRNQDHIRVRMYLVHQPQFKNAAYTSNVANFDETEWKFKCYARCFAARP